MMCLIFHMTRFSLFCFSGKGSKVLNSMFLQKPPNACPHKDTEIDSCGSISFNIKQVSVHRDLVHRQSANKQVNMEYPLKNSALC